MKLYIGICLNPWLDESSLPFTCPLPLCSSSRHSHSSSTGAALPPCSVSMSWQMLSIVLPALSYQHCQNIFLLSWDLLELKLLPNPFSWCWNWALRIFFSFPPLLLHCDNFPCTTKQTSDFPKLVPTPVLSCGQRHLSVLSQNCQHTKGPAVVTAAEIPGAHPPFALQGRANSFLIKLCL